WRSRGRPGRPGLTDARGPASAPGPPDRKSTRLNSSHLVISYAVFCLKKKSVRSEEHTSELQSPCNLVCRLLLGTKGEEAHTPVTKLVADLALEGVAAKSQRRRPCRTSLRTTNPRVSR